MQPFLPQRKSLLFLLSLIALIFTSCSTPAIVLSPSATSSPSSTFTYTASPTFTPTITPTPTATSTPTVTPTLSLPLSIETPIPAKLSTIDSASAASLREIVGYTINPFGIWKAGGEFAYFATREHVEVFNNSTGEPSAVIPEGPVFSSRFIDYNDDLQVSNSGQLILVNHSGVKVYDHLGNLLYSYALDPSMHLLNRGVAISGSGKLAVVSLEYSTAESLLDIFKGGATNTIFQLISIPDGSVLYSWNGYGRTMHGLKPSFYANDTMLATEFDNSVWLWNIDDQSLVQQFIPHGAPWTISPDGSKYAYVVGSSLSIFDTASRQLIRSISLDSDQAYYPPFFTSDSTMIQLYDRNGDQYFQYNAESGEFLGNVPYVNPIKNQLSSKYELPIDNSLNLPQEFVLPAPLVDQNNKAISFPYRIFSSLDDLVIRDASSQTDLVSTNWSGYLLDVAAFDRESQFAFYGIWDTPNKPRGVYGFSGKSNRVEVGWSNYWIKAILLSPQENLAAIMMTNQQESYYGNGLLVIYDIKNLAVVWEKSHDLAIFGGFSLDETSLLLAGRNSASLMHIGSPTEPFKVEDHPLPGLEKTWITAAAMSPDCRFLAVAVFSMPVDKVRLYDLQTNTLLTDFQPFINDEVKSLKFSNDGSLLQVVSTNGWYKLWGIYP